MRLTLIALAALAVAGSAPAAACDAPYCAERALADDSYPLGETPLPPHVKALVAARDGRGLSLAGFYNDPSLAFAPRDYAPAGYDYAPPPPAYVEPAPVDYGYYPHWRHRPHVIASPYGHGHHYAGHEAPERYGHHVY